MQTAKESSFSVLVTSLFALYLALRTTTCLCLIALCNKSLDSHSEGFLTLLI